MKITSKRIINLVRKNKTYAHKPNNHEVNARKSVSNGKKQIAKGSLLILLVED